MGLFITEGILALVLAGCSNLVTVTQIGTPKINIGAFPSGGGNVEIPNTGGPGIINVDIGTNLMFSGSATNSGGVHDFSIEVIQAASSLYTASASNTPNAGNQVHDPLHILGTNGTGGAGNQSMIVNNMIAPVQVKTSATGFGPGTNNNFTVTYVPVDPKQRGKDHNINITLKRDIGSNLYTAVFPVTPISGTIVAIGNPGASEVIFLRNGFPATNCANNLNPSAWLIISPGGQTFPADMNALFGPSLKLPVKIVACANPSNPSPPDHVEIRVTYHIN